MTIATVKVAAPKGYKATRFMNAGVASSLDSYCRREESKQINDIVCDLLKATAEKSLARGVAFIYPLLMQSQNSESVKCEIIRRYVTAKESSEVAL